MKAIQSRLLTWYRKESRKGLPWRETRDPYAIWVSETMLQQTQVATVIPYYERFLRRFPTVHALSKAPLTQVLEAWSGLGYYTRAKNLHACAQKIVREHAGKIPDQVDSLIELPGIGRYTAGAIASIAYDRPAPVLDGNVQRVLARYFGIREDPRQPSVQRKLWELAGRILPSEYPGDFNQALMDLGATVCTPRRPQCSSCPLTEDCIAHRNSWEESIPPPRQPLQRKKIDYLCGILERNGSVLVARRPLIGLLPGLWEFPGGERERGEPPPEALRRLLADRLGIRVKAVTPCATQTQILSHRELHIRAFTCQWSGKRIRPRWYTKTRWVPKRNLKQTPFTAGMAKLALLALLLGGCATVGPSIGRDELRSAREYYEVKARRHIYQQLLRARTIGERLLKALPPETRLPKPGPFVGVIVDDLSLASGRVFAVPGMEPNPQAKDRKTGRVRKACLIVGILPNSPASDAGLQPGDLLVQIANKKTPDARSVVGIFHGLKPGEKVPLSLEREGVPFQRDLTVGEKLYPVTFIVEDEESVNAFASPGQITVSSGLLRFVQSDDELAVVMAHELAHLTRGHIAKGLGPNILAGIIGGVAGTALDIIVPGAGGLLNQVMFAGIRAPFSQDFEREADYIGLRYVYTASYRIEAALTFWDRFATELPRSLSESFFNTHPTSPERLLRLKKTIEELKGRKA